MFFLAIFLFKLDEHCMVCFKYICLRDASNKVSVLELEAWQYKLISWWRKAQARLKYESLFTAIWFIYLIANEINFNARSDVTASNLAWKNLMMEIFLSISLGNGRRKLTQTMNRAGKKKDVNMWGQVIPTTQWIKCEHHGCEHQHRPTHVHYKTFTSRITRRGANRDNFWKSLTIT